MMVGLCSIFALFYALVSWRVVHGVEPKFESMNNFAEKDIFHAKGSRISHDFPDMRFVLNNLLRYENTIRHPTEADNIFTLSSRSKGAAIPSDDPLAILATGFHGSRGKRLPMNNDEIPIFANGFPANRG